jgi:membrane protein YqaA with SNARE-associated domain
MEQLTGTYGYPALFAVSFLAATLLPLGSEWLLVAMVLQQFNPVSAVTVATAGNCLGALTTYYLGLVGSEFLVRKLFRIDANQQHKAERFYQRYGSWSLLLSWLPVIGDPICLVGGILKVPFTRFSLLVLAGKSARYAVVAYLTIQGAPLLKQ